jgi:magnesium-transporting ATPase (P-type)
LILHHFIGLKLIFVVNISHYSLILLKIIIQGHRPLWDLRNRKLLKETSCMTDYASPSLFLFFIFFFYLYSIISIQKLKKQKIQLIPRIFIFLIHSILTFGILIMISSTLNEYFHQLIFTIILGYILICLLLAKDKKIHNFIFQTLKNIYNARRYKIKTFFYVIGLIIITLISSYFIDENDLD